MPSIDARHRALAALVLLTLIWGYNWIVLKYVLVYTDPIPFVALRNVLGTLVLFGVLALRRESMRPPPIAMTLAIGLAQTTGFQMLAQMALVGGGAGKTALLAYTMPFWVVLFAWFVLDERPTRRQWTSLAIAALGLVLILEPWHGLAGLASTLLALSSGLCWGIGTVLSKRLFARTPVTPLNLTAWQMAFGTVVAAVVALAWPHREIVWSGAMIGGLVYNALLASGLAWALWAFVVERLPTHVAGLASLAVPTCGVLLAWMLLSERPSAAEALGMLLIGVALVAVTRAPRSDVAT